MTKRSSFVFCFLTLTSVAAFAQDSGVSVGLSPVPIWPEDGFISPELGDRYVFLDPEAGQLVLSYPENLGRTDFERNPGARRLTRIDLNVQVAASVSVAVEHSGSEFEYRYRVSNDERAERPIQHFDIAVPTFGEGDDAISAPANWSSVANPITDNAIQWAGQRPSLVRWYADVPPRVGQPQVSAINPGTGREGFAVSSALSPGFTAAYAFGGTPPTLDADIPSVVREQAEPMLRSLGRLPLTIGPTFAAEAPMIVIAADFHLGISRLISSGALDASSPAVREALHALEGYLDYMAAAYPPDITDEVPLSDLPGPPLVFRETPQDGVEAEILEAMKLSLVD